MVFNAMVLPLPVLPAINMCGMRATALLDPAVTTCISNDYGYDQIYAKQLVAFLHSKDILIAISSSGKSKSIILVYQKFCVNMWKIDLILPVLIELPKKSKTS